jgi:hypothetical protein
MVEIDIYQLIPMNILISVIIIVGIIALIQNSQQLLCQWKSFQTKPKPKGRVSHSYQTDPKNRYLQKDLLTLLKGDVVTAKRLLAQQRRKQPGKTDNWYLEKVIFDLERDRR